MLGCSTVVPATIEERRARRPIGRDADAFQRMLETVERFAMCRANGQPALVVHKHAGGGRYEPYGIQVLTLGADRIARITAFNDPSLVAAFAHHLEMH